MTSLQTTAHAKLNLTLDVLGKRNDGYHDLRMVMQEIALGDGLILEIETGQPWSVKSDSGAVPCDESNLAVRAARLFFKETGLNCHGLTVKLQKRTPVCAGMGGGSADGAAVLRLLQDYYGMPIPEERLYALAEQVGSDVPFALFGGTALAEEKGQILTRLPAMPKCHIVLCKPDFPVSTPVLFRAIDSEIILERPHTEQMVAALCCGDLGAVAASLRNVFEPVVARAHPELGSIQSIMMECGALGAAMTGSGPTMFGLYDRLDLAERAVSALIERHSDTFLTEPV